MKVPQELVKTVHRLESCLNSPEAVKVVLTFEQGQVSSMQVTQTGGSHGKTEDQASQGPDQSS